MSKVIAGKLEAFAETGTEGYIWTLYDDTKVGHYGLNFLQDGDHLTIYHPTQRQIVWQGNVDLEYETNYQPFPLNPEYGQQAVNGMWVHGVQRDVVPETWASWFTAKYPAELITAGFGKLYRCNSSTITGHQWNGKGSRYNQIKDTGDLIIKFKNSGYYRYKAVDADTYWAFYEAESMGKYFAQHIKNKFEVEKLELPRPARFSTNPPRPWAHRRSIGEHDRFLNSPLDE